MKQTRTPVRIKKVLSHYDAILAILVLLICVFGLIMIYSASSYRAQYYYQDSKLYFRRQGYFLIGGTALMILVSLINYRVFFKSVTIFKKKVPILVFFMLICIALQWYTFFNGHEAGGSSRWIQLGGFNLQPSELSKVLFVLGGAFVARWFKFVFNTGNVFKNFLGYICCMAAFALILIPVVKQNLSSAIILAGILTVIYFCASMDKKYFILVFICLVIGSFILVKAEGYRSTRLEHFLDSDTMDPGDQILQGMYAIASGGLMGKGLGNSVQKLGNIPEVHTDMIFTIICEELGIIGGIALIGLFLLLLWRIFKIALNAPDLYGSFLATGVFAQIALQVMMNIAVVTNSMPATGVPLPFVSYGGSSLLILMAEMGIVLSVSKRTNEVIEEPEDVDFA